MPGSLGWMARTAPATAEPPVRRAEGAGMGLMRFTVVDSRSTVSFIGPDRALHALVAACATGADSIEQLLDTIAPFVGELRERVLSGLAVFDEHNSRGNTRWIHAAFDYCSREEVPVFRVLDDRTREISL